jgi:hypothetical protein
MRKQKEKHKQNFSYRMFDVPLSREDCIHRLEKLFERSYMRANDGIEFLRVDHRTYEFFAQYSGIEVYGQLINNNEIPTEVAYNVSFDERGLLRVGCPALMIICIVLIVFSRSTMISGDSTPLLLLIPILLYDLYYTRRQRRRLAGEIRDNLLDSSKSKNL